jgi:hypothetical protein
MAFWFSKNYQIWRLNKIGESPASVSKSLAGELAKLESCNRLNVHADYFQEAMDRLCTRFLDVPLEAVIHPVSNAVQEIVQGQKVAANRAAQVRHEDLSAQEWFEGIRVPGSKQPG